MRSSLRRLAAVAVIGALGAGACSSSSAPHGTTQPTTSGGTMRLAVVGLDSLDPAQIVPTNQADMIAVDLLDEGLTAIDPVHNVAVPALATHWSTDGSGSSATTGGTTPSATVGRTWTFDLDSHAEFSDGSKVTAADVVTSLTTVAALGSTTLAGARLDVVEGYTDLVTHRSTSLSGLRADGDKVEITTDAPDAELPLLLASPVYAVTKPAPSASTTTTAASATALTAPIGSGPFKVASDDGTTLALVRSANSDAQLDQVDLIRYATPAAALAAVHDAKADWAAVPPSEKASVADDNVAYPVQAPLGAEQFFGMNLASPTFANPLFRQAIIKAVDRQAIVAKVLPGLLVSSGVVPPAVPGGVADPCGATCTYDQKASKQLLKRAFPGGRIPIVEIDTDADPNDVALSNAVAFDLGEVGIRVQVKPRTFVDYQRFITTGKQQLFRTGWVGLWPSAGAYLGPLFRSSSLDNATAYKSASTDARLAAAMATIDDAARQSDYASVQRTIMADAAVVPIASYVQVVALSKRVQGYAARLDGTFDVLTVQVSGSTG